MKQQEKARKVRKIQKKIESDMKKVELAGKR